MSSELSAMALGAIGLVGSTVGVLLARERSRVVAFAGFLAFGFGAVCIAALAGVVHQ